MMGLLAAAIVLLPAASNDAPKPARIQLVIRQRDRQKT
jgi:hypothetical protein